MADILVTNTGTTTSVTTPARVEISDVQQEVSLGLTARVDITAGQMITPDATGGWVLASANGAGLFGNVYMAGKTVKAGQNLTGIKVCRVDGLVIGALTIGTLLYLSNTPGGIADAAGTNSVVIGRVIPGPAFPKGGTVDRLLQLRIGL